MTQKLVVCNDATKRQLLTYVERLDTNKPIEFSFKPFKARRSLSANALYWKWVSIMVTHFNSKGAKYTTEFLHDALKHTFLGYKESPDSKLDIPPQLKDSRTLSTADFCRYMEQVEAWAIDRGCFLPRPEDSAYEKYLQGVR
ncbi:hypothetical protein [uncultured Endozoicomonas sp.]|uniref:hypothetical protein n=1 Tax=uncultured Endozoicomonas sp. TaxID=432652 RepID=UPI0026019B92|nr:hypothetical protein [uncultured Endozoicomonas sp.]